MRTQVRDTSLETFHSLGVKSYLQPQERAVMAVFNQSPDKSFTRKQISLLTGIPINCVCGRVRSLLDKSQIEITGEAVDSVSKKPQELLGLPVAEQKDLFK